MSSLSEILPRGLWTYNGNVLGRTPDSAPWLVAIVHGHYSHPKLRGRTFGTAGSFADKEMVIRSTRAVSKRRHYVKVDFRSQGVKLNQTIIIEKGNGPGEVYVYPRADLRLTPKSFEIYKPPRTVKIRGGQLTACCVTALEEINRLGFLPAKLDMVSAVADAFAMLDVFTGIPQAINAAVNKYASLGTPSLSSMVAGPTKRRMESIVQGELAMHPNGAVGSFWKSFSKAWGLQVTS